ncbi:18234_t:CDS:10 [Entrophospora sp. SA101]|nr:5006_t:CDS:10 [Entrophospora sp. SA101]CAJ0754551.1 18234_t:CDS:10 [Entrophospora sp. SA101]CAJ0832685.1 9906_t:CDS:10 [Entrophospora sp. SA101]CAJ0848880.1 20323_t:CDS:10 [Entrophospora sp. SA101]
MEFKDLDPRLSRALSKLNFHKPTLIQAKTIPLALSGKDILARARTGSGKTAAYCLPIIQKILNVKENISEYSSERMATRALILVPTRELAEQITKHINDFLLYCSKEVRVINIANNTPLQLQRPILSELPDIVVSTPSRVLAHLESQSLVINNSLESLAIDEADLILSYGYEEDIMKILTYIPKMFQCYLMSATLSKDVENLKHLLLRNPAILTLHEQDEPNLLTQYCIRCSEIDKFLLIYVVLKLGLIKGKCLIFVNDIDRCYRLKLFLEQFSIKSCVLNSELPLNSRFHIVQEFNKGVYDYIIATDESDLKSEKDSDNESVEENDDEQEEESPIVESTKTVEEGPKTKKLRKNREDKEYGVSRGIDFINVAAVINFDFPTSAKSYTHRVGRTARANQKGMSLSFIVPRELVGKNKNFTYPAAKHDEEIYGRVEKKQTLSGAKINPYTFDIKQVEGFRYRVEDALRAVTKIMIKEARLKDIKSEILKSEKLKAHFEDNPNDLKVLRHDTVFHHSRVQQHMKHIPPYLMPKIAPPPTSSSVTDSEHTDSKVSGNIPFQKSFQQSKKSKKKTKYIPKKRKNDPLKTFSIGKSSIANNKNKKQDVIIKEDDSKLHCLFQIANKMLNEHMYAVKM